MRTIAEFIVMAAGSLRLATPGRSRTLSGPAIYEPCAISSFMAFFSVEPPPFLNSNGQEKFRARALNNCSSDPRDASAEQIFMVFQKVTHGLFTLGPADAVADQRSAYPPTPPSLPPRPTPA